MIEILGFGQRRTFQVQAWQVKAFRSHSCCSLRQTKTRGNIEMQTSLTATKGFSRPLRGGDVAILKGMRAVPGKLSGAKQRCFPTQKVYRQRGEKIGASRHIVCNADSVEVDGRLGDRWQDIRKDLLNFKEEGKVRFTVNTETNGTVRTRVQV